MTVKQKQLKKNNVQNFEKREAEKDRLRRAMTAAGTFEVECVNCGEAVILISTGQSQSDREDEREYVTDCVFRIKRDPSQTLYKEVPVRCRGCGLKWSDETLRIKDAD